MARKILLADDSVTAQNMGRKILTDAGYEVVTVNNGSAALKKIAEQKPDLIVLDVYMPGYSGLEVCQRIKESKETSRIPILLTVGKLEPFKPEEARKARADAYVVKPFEASELLVALTKLEDKIVPRPEPYRPGRFAKAIAAVERFNQSESEDFGDKDSGWKNRIKFPSRKSAEPEPEPEIVTRRKSILGLEDVPPAEPNRAFERPIPEGLPKDITPEEIEAITAAAAQLTSGDEAPSESEAAGEDATAAPSEAMHGDEVAPVTLADATQTIGESESNPEAPSVAQESGPVVEAARAQEQVHSEEAPQSREDRAEQKQDYAPSAAISPEEVPASQPEAAESSGSSSDAEVMAALQNLSPANGNGASEFAAAAAAELIAAEAEAVGPRWIAERVALDSQEATLALEREMQKAFAAFAAADGARATFAAVSMEASDRGFDEPASIASAVAQEYSPQPLTSTYSSGSDLGGSMPAAAESVAQPSQIESAQPSAMASASEPGAAPEHEPAPDMGSQSNFISSTQESESAQSANPVPAASSSAASDSPSAEVPVPPLTVASSGPDHIAAGQEGIEHKEASDEMAAKAAAWENWGQIRNAVLGSTSEFGEAAGSPKDDQQEPEPEAMAAAAAAGNASSASEGDSTAIASIVDSVLAELKPKLMEEIARKMKKDSKKE